MSLREKKKLETKNRIFEVSGRLFKEKGFENTTIDAITKEVGIAKGTFFNYFPTKESLFLYFREQKHELVNDLLDAERSKNAPSREKIKSFLVRLAESYEKDKELSKLFILEYKRYVVHSGLKPDDEKSMHNRFNRILYGLLEEGVGNGEIRSSTDLKKAAEMLNVIYLHTLIVWLRSDNDFSFSGDISAKIDMLFEGIGIESNVCNRG